ncbi:unnamed protein product [Urochloa decumbens]|uniref:Uncharacterized protein n=1 Tax=Urochloa decumbens TaxID=240449 RepID=A0ABC9ACE6_9POAL
MEPRKSSYLVALVLASLLLSAMAGGHRKMLLNKDDAESMEMAESMEQLQEDDEAVAAAVHERILRQVKKMDDYGSYNPTPTMSKPHFKDIPN